MANNAHIPVEDIALVLQGKSLVDTSRLVFRDPNHFRAGELGRRRRTTLWMCFLQIIIYLSIYLLHRHTPQWLSLLDDLNDDRFSEVRDWITNGVDVTKFFRPFTGSYKGKNYECSTPPRCVLPNHMSCKPFTSFISNTLINRLRSEAISLWGKVGQCTPPHLVLPLTVEPSKPRLSVTMTDFLSFGLKTVHFPWIVSNICLSMFIKAFTRQCVTTSQHTVT